MPKDQEHIFTSKLNQETSGKHKHMVDFGKWVINLNSFV